MKECLKKEKNEKSNLGVAIGQINKHFIISQNEEDLIVINVHEAREVVLYEKIKKEWKKEITK